jgi:hypothetical protein
MPITTRIRLAKLIADYMFLAAVFVPPAAILAGVIFLLTARRAAR